MRVLGFDTADDYCALALTENGQKTAICMVETARDQAKILASLTQDFIEKNNLKISAIDKFSIATGPGSFTGLRVGLAFARGLGLATGKPVFGFDHFACTQQAAASDKPLLIIRDSKRSDFFACRFDESGKRHDPFLADIETLEKEIQNALAMNIAGNGAEKLCQAHAELKGRLITLPPEACALQAALLASAAETAAAHPPQPLYLREADVTFPKAS
jgi:tRNA threonylcarbamoyladenosine biosynthesis protein TsaB